MEGEIAAETILKDLKQKEEGQQSEGQASKEQLEKLALHEKQRVTRFASHSYVKQKKQCMMKLTSILAFAFLLVSSISHTPLFEQYFLSVFSCLLGYAAFSSIFLL